MTQALSPGPLSLLLAWLPELLFGLLFPGWTDCGPGEGLKAGLASEVQGRPVHVAEVYRLAKRTNRVNEK